MNKILRFSLMAILAIVGFGNAMAQGVTFDFDNDYATLFPDLPGVSSNESHDGDFTATMTSTAVSGYTVTVSPKAEGVNNPNRIFSSVPRLRMYSGTLIVQGPSIKKIEFTSSANKFDVTPDVGTLDGKVWTGEADAVTFTINKNTQLNKIVINGDGGAVVTEGQTAETAITVTRALEIINALDGGATTGETYYVKGIVTDIDKITSSSAGFKFADNASSGDKLTTYNTKGLGNKTITNTEFVKANDNVVVFGQLQKFEKDGTMTPEIKNGYVYSVNGKTEDDTPNPEDAITNGKEADSPMTVAQALEYIKGFSDGFTTTNKYYVEGTVSEVTEINVEYGNATFLMGELKAYHLQGLENKKITDANYLKANDQVVVYAKLQKYGSGDAATPELSSGYIYKLNGKTKEGGDDPGTYTPVGNGTKTNPYTVQDILHMATPESSSVVEGQEPVWLKGFIVGALNSAGTAFAEDVPSNIAIAETASETEGKNCVPVQLPTGTMRAGLNIVDNPENKGKDVIVCGYLLKYMSRAGLKNLTAYILNGEEVVAGINSITADQQKNGAVYNLKGQRVNQSYKGLVIKNGVKTIQK